MRQKSKLLPDLKRRTAEFRRSYREVKAAARNPEVRKQVLSVERLFRKHEVDCYISVYSNNVTISASLLDLEGFKCDKLTTLLFELMGLMQGAEMETKEYAAYTNRDYIFKARPVEVRVNAYVKDDSATCKRVKTGTKIVEVDEYTIVCD